MFETIWGHLDNFFEYKSERLHEVVMPSTMSSAPRSDITNQIEQLKRSMDILEIRRDSGLSSDDSDSDIEAKLNIIQNASVLENRHNVANTNHKLKQKRNGLIFRRQNSTVSLNRQKSIELVKSVTAAHSKSAKTSGFSDRKWNSEDKSNKQDNNEKSMEDVIHCYDVKVYLPITAGQSPDDVDVPIISPPPLENKKVFDFEHPNSARSTRSFSLHFLLAGDKLNCEFGNKTGANAEELLLESSENRMLAQKSDCLCSRDSYNETIGGWDMPASHTSKSKSGKRRKSKLTSSETAFSRLTGTPYNDKDDPVAFQHYRDRSKYIERYRFFHTVGRVCQTDPNRKPLPIKKHVTSDPYYNNMKSICTMASSTDFFNLLHKKEKPRVSSASSSESNNEKSKSDEESSIEVRPYSMKDRGKALNLAPVRENTGTDILPPEQLDQYQKNRLALDQYLNLITPPTPVNYAFDDDTEVKVKRHQTKSTLYSESGLFPVCSPRRGARTLRLGSAEFMKPGSGTAVETKWSCERRTIPRAATFHTSTVPGALIVGSTIITQGPIPRGKSGGNRSPYVQFQKEQTQFQQQTNLSQTPTKKYGKMCDRVTELSSANDRNRFSYTHSKNHGKNSPHCHSTATVVDLKEGLYAPTKRSVEKTRSVMLDVNHLGIRGRTYKQDEQINIMYKNRRTASLKS